MHACGGQAHSIALTKNGKLYTFGCNTYGQLGIGTTVKSTLPVKVFGVQENITLVATHYFHSVRVPSAAIFEFGTSIRGNFLFFFLVSIVGLEPIVYVGLQSTRA